MPGKSVLLLRVVMLVAGTVLVLAAGFLFFHHPLRGEWILGSLCVAVFFTAAFYPPVVLFLVPSLLPVVDLAPWTGWITFEEYDLVVLLLMGGAYLRHALAFPRYVEKTHGAREIWGGLLLFAMLGSVLISMVRGLSESGGFSFGWFHGYYEPMNSIRLAKPYLLAVLLLPLFLMFGARETKEGHRFPLLGLGMTAGLCLVSLTTIWERVAFLGLLDFSSDYRTTALFWEMHVGGAALDGFLALSVPFAVHELIFAKSRWHLAFVLTALALACYACLTTFSRGVYAAIPIALGVSAWLSMRQLGAGNLLAVVRKSAIAIAFSAVALFAIAAYWIFETSGYRGMFAFWVASGLFYPLALALAQVSTATWWRGILQGLLSSMICLGLAISVPKGAYLVFAVSALLTAGSLVLRHRRASANGQGLLIATYVSTLSSGVLVAWHWGGDEAIASMTISCAILLCGIFSASRRVLPPCGLRAQLSVAVVLALIAAIVAIFSGGRYMADRFSTTNKDLDYRLQHWATGLGQLQGGDWWLGKGLGRVPATYFFAAPHSEYPGGFHLQSDPSGNAYLRLVGGRHINGWGEIFRVTQRIRPEMGEYSVQFDVRAEKDVSFVFEVCAKHLLYQGRCVARSVDVKGSSGTWQRMKVDLQGDLPGGGAWYAPELVVFSIAMLSGGGVADFDNLALNNNGRELLTNGNFENDLARWFSSSDKYHMPWHMKNLFLHILFEQGALGLLVLFVMLLTVCFRLVWGKAQRHPIAPALAGSLVGFCVVGVFDSLLDVPRVATLFYLLLLLGLFVRNQNNEHKILRFPQGQDGDPDGGRTVLCLESECMMPTTAKEPFSMTTHKKAVLTGRPEFSAGEFADLARSEGDLAAWERLFTRHGPCGVKDVAGDFAVGLADANGRTILAVDRFAIRSLCYRVKDGEIHFASRADELADAQTEIDTQAIFDYLYFHVIPSPRTIFKNIYRLPPGHYAVFENGQLRLGRYWVPEFQEKNRASFDQLRAEFRDLLAKGVRRQLDGGKPGCFLSGGTDSSTVAGMIGQVSGQPAATYSIGFDAAGYDEMEYARIAARHFNTDHHEYYVTPADLVRSIPDVARYYDQPFGNSSALPAYYCAKMAREDGLTRILAGDGGDELFGGNTRYAKQKVFGFYDQLSPTLRHALLEPLLLESPLGKLPLLRKGASYIRQAKVPLPDRTQTYNLLCRFGIHDVFTPDFLEGIDLAGPTAQQREVWAETGRATQTNKELAFDWRYTLAECDLPKVVGTTMLAGIEVGFPMLDTELLAFSMRLPTEYKLKGLKLRWFFKEALRGFLPDEILTKKKQGFGLPFGVWVTQNSELKDLAENSVRALAERKIFKQDFVDRIFMHLREHPGYYGEMIWISIMLEQWLRGHDEKRAQSTQQ